MQAVADHAFWMYPEEVMASLPGAKGFLVCCVQIDCVDEARHWIQHSGVAEQGTGQYFIEVFLSCRYYKCLVAGLLVLPNTAGAAAEVQTCDTNAAESC